MDRPSSVGMATMSIFNSSHKLILYNTGSPDVLGNLIIFGAPPKMGTYWDEMKAEEGRRASGVGVGPLTGLVVRSDKMRGVVVAVGGPTGGVGQGICDPGRSPGDVIGLPDIRDMFNRQEGAGANGGLNNLE
jgi:hypothetical protein